MTEILRIITCLGHSPERQELNGIIFRSILGRCKQRVEFLRYFLAVAGRAHLVAEVAYEVAQILDLFLIWLIMDTIYKGLCGLSAL